MSDQTFILARVEFDANGGCWLWSRYTNKSGYGRTTRRGKVHAAHRLSWEASRGPIPKDKVVCHRCDTPACVNPAHLFLGSPRDNIEDAMRKGRNIAGEAHPNAKLTMVMVEEIRAMCAAGSLYREAAKAFGVHVATVGGIIRREAWRA